MNEVNAKFYVLFNVDNMKFVYGYSNGSCTYSSLAHRAKEYQSKERAEATRNRLKEKDKLIVKEVNVIVCNIP